MAYKIAFFGAKPYDIASFDKVNEKYNTTFVTTKDI